MSILNGGGKMFWPNGPFCNGSLHYHRSYKRAASTAVEPKPIIYSFQKEDFHYRSLNERKACMYRRNENFPQHGSTSRTLLDICRLVELEHVISAG